MTHFEIEIVSGDMFLAVWDGAIDLTVETGDGNQPVSFGEGEDFSFGVVAEEGEVTQLLEAPENFVGIADKDTEPDSEKPDIPIDSNQNDDDSSDDGGGVPTSSKMVNAKTQEIPLNENISVSITALNNETRYEVELIDGDMFLAVWAGSVNYAVNGVNEPARASLGPEEKYSFVKVMDDGGIVELDNAPDNFTSDGDTNSVESIKNDESMSESVIPILFREANEEEAGEQDVSEFEKLRATLWQHMISEYGSLLIEDRFTEYSGYSTIFGSRFFEPFFSEPAFARNYRSDLGVEVSGTPFPRYEKPIHLKEIDPEVPDGLQRDGYDHKLINLFGGNRSSQCPPGSEPEKAGVFLGMCRDPQKRAFGNHDILLPKWTFSEEESFGQDKYFLGGFLADDSPFASHYNGLIDENSKLKSRNDILEVENKSLELQVGELTGSTEASSSPVFPYVNWNRANRSKAWYKDVDWSVIPFNHLNDNEKESLDWSKVNYTEAINNDSFDTALIDWSDISAAKKAHQIKAYKAIDWASVDFTALDEGDKESIDWTKVNYAKAQASEEFDIFSLDWDFLNQLSTQFKKKVYQKVAWNKVDFSAGDSSAFDWAAINLKKAMASDAFTLDAVDIDETKQTKNFKRLSAVLKKSSNDDLIAGASDEALLALGYENFVGKIADSLIKNFTTTSREYSMILKPLSYTRAAAVATAMGGSLAPQATGDSYDYELVDEIQFLASSNQIARKLFSSQADDRPLAWFDAVTGQGSQITYSALDLQSFDQYSGVEGDSLNHENKLWFVVDRGAAALSTPDQSVPIVAAPVDLMPEQSGLTTILPAAVSHDTSTLN